MNGRGCAPAALGLFSRSDASGSPIAPIASAHEGDHCTLFPLHMRLGAGEGVLTGLTLLAAGINRPCHDRHDLVFPVGLLLFFLTVSAFPDGPQYCPGRPCRGAFAQHL
ncbi:hypothetical protein HK16_12435 [Acetobacter senegalensis]|uniref:Uncharacterized protein n=2 Tax=Acetobacter TaxID=434 RepID=A0A252EHX3_9PROT|nr:hypothetical protein CIW82_18480 [Acetobacter tropicalis]OUL66065.1 hypothetical protein HK16_12435 [Acetobacter senegalensis]